MPIPRLARIVTLACVAAAAFHGTTPPASAADWPQFRGPTRDGVAAVDPSALPDTWTPEQNVRWKAALPQPGNSSPVVVGNRVYVSCAEDEKGRRRGLYCFDRASGKRLWERVVPFDQAEPTHATNPYCAASPAADEAGVIAWHGSAGLHSYAPDGAPQWNCDLGVIRHIWGYAASPVLDGDRVYLNAGPGNRQFVCAIDRKTGRVIWNTDEPGGAEDKSPVTQNWIGSWSTPRVVDFGGQKRLLVFMATRVRAYDPDSGKIVWTASGTGPLAYSDAYVSPPQPDGSRIAVAMAGYGGQAIGFRCTADQATPLWQSSEKPPQRIGTGVLLGDRMIVPNEPGIACYDLQTGRPIWQQSIRGERFWGGIVRAGDRLYLTSKSGTTYVFAADPTGYRQISANPLCEASNSTPAITGDAIYLRTAGHLWCVAKPEGGKP